MALVGRDLRMRAPPIKVGSYPEGIAVTRDGRKAYVANWFSDTVSVIDIETAKEIRRIRCAAGPRVIVTER